MTSRRELKNYAKQAMSGKYGILILAFVAVQALALISSMISSALFPGEETIDIVLSYAFTFILTLLINVVAAGIESGKSIRLKGKGYPGVGGGEAGDLLLKVNVQDKPGYKREGRDIYTTVNIPFTTAVFGGEAKVHTIYGDVLCNIKPGTQSGTKIRLRGKGIVAMNNPSVHGDEYATVQIEVPTNLTPEARRKLKEFEQECNGSRRSRGFGSGSAA